MTSGPEQHTPDDNTTTDEAPQQLQGFMGNDEWDALLAHANNQIHALVDHPDKKTRKQVLALLQAVDQMHREPLTRLVRLFKEGVLEKVVTDPPIHTLMELYDLLPVQGDSTADAPPPKPSSQRPFPNIPIRVESRAKPAVGRKAPPKPRPHWVPVLGALDDIAKGEVRKVCADDRDLLLCRVKNQELFALDIDCAQDGQSLANATLNQYSLICPQHPACYYDVRQGTRIAGPGKIECYPVKIEDDERVMVGIGMEFEPKLPTF